MSKKTSSLVDNLELMPLRMNESKNDKIGARQLDLAKKLHSAGLLSAEGKQKIDSHPPGRGAWRGNPPPRWRRTDGWGESRAGWALMPEHRTSNIQRRTVNFEARTL